MLKRVGIGFIALAVLLIAVLFLFQAQIGSTLFKRAVEQSAQRDSMAGLADGLHVGLCGTGSPLPNPDRAGPCNVVIAGDQMFIVDIGEGGGRNIALMGLDVSKASGLLLTHFHSDHLDGIGPLMLMHWTRGQTATPLAVYGPTGVEPVIDGFNAAYATDKTYRVAHHGKAVVPSTGGGAEARSFEIADGDVAIFTNDGLTITAFNVDHEPIAPAVGYRFDYKGRSICFSGDTAKSANLARACKDVDMLVHEALQPALVKEMQAAQEARGNAATAKIMFDIQDYHASPEDAAESAQTAGAKMLVLSHLVPPLPLTYLYPAFLGDAENRYDGPIVVGEDGMFFTLPADSDAIDQARLM